MCRITDYQYTCKHRIQHIWSTCRGQIKVGKDSAAPACQKLPSLYARYATKCGSCSRTEAEQNIRLALSETNEQSTEDFESTLEDRLAELAKQIPTTNWRSLPSPVYSRKPSQKRVRTPRKNSLLMNEVKPEDACGPELWENNVVLPVYEAVDDGWNFPWTAETKSLTEELAEDEECRRKVLKGGEVNEDGEDEDEDEEAEGDDDDLDGEDDCEVEAEVVSNDKSPGEPQETIEAEVNESSVKVRHRFRKTTRGSKAHWELVGV